MKDKEFIKLILNDSYVEWLDNSIAKYKKVDDCYFVHNYKYFLGEKEIQFIHYLPILFDELNKYCFNNNIPIILRTNRLSYHKRCLSNCFSNYGK